MRGTTVLPILCAAATSTAAAAAAIVLDAPLRESYAGVSAEVDDLLGPSLMGELADRSQMTAAVSGVRIVGVLVGPSPGPADLSRVQLMLPGGAAAQPICFRATTRDGLYWASGRLQAPARAQGPARLSFVSKWRKELARYAASDLAIRATVGARCETDPTPEFIATSHGGAASYLHVMVQSRGASVRLTLTDAANRDAAGTCQKATGRVMTAFDTDCRVDLGTQRRNGRATIRLDMRQRSGTASAETATLLWSA